MNWAKVENNQVIQIGLPKTGTLKVGSTVSGYDLLEEAVLREEGWLPLEYSKPSYNEESQYLEFEGYEVTEDKVIPKYIIKDLIIPSPQPYFSLDDYLLDLDFRVSLLELGL